MVYLCISTRFHLYNGKYSPYLVLVREKNRPVRLRHSWNSNHFFSSLYLYNVTRHSNHHSNSNLKFWELKPVDKDAPLLPYGYLTMLYLVLIFPFLYKKIMKTGYPNSEKIKSDCFLKKLLLYGK